MDEAERLKPTDPRIKQMRAQNEVRDEFSVPADSSNPAGFNLVQVKNAGHDALEQGAWEKAKKRYQQLDTLGYNPTYAKLNLAMAAIGADAYKVAREHLSAFTPYANSATGLHVTALRMICNIAERGNGKEFARQLEELKE